MLTRETILKFDITGDKDIMTCNHCKESSEIPFPFFPYTYFNGKYKVKVTTRYKMIENFLEQHYGKYMLSLQGKK
jgi:hypothetical protein